MNWLTWKRYPKRDCELGGVFLNVDWVGSCSGTVCHYLWSRLHHVAISCQFPILRVCEPNEFLAILPILSFLVLFSSSQFPIHCSSPLPLFFPSSPPPPNQNKTKPEKDQLTPATPKFSTAGILWPANPPKNQYQLSPFSKSVASVLNSKRETHLSNLIRVPWGDLGRIGNSVLGLLWDAWLLSVFCISVSMRRCV